MLSIEVARRGAGRGHVACPLRRTRDQGTGDLAFVRHPALHRPFRRQDGDRAAVGREVVHAADREDVGQSAACERPAHAGAHRAAHEVAQIAKTGDAFDAKERDAVHLRADLLLHFRIRARRRRAHVGAGTGQRVHRWLGPSLPGVEHELHRPLRRQRRVQMEVPEGASVAQIASAAQSGQVAALQNR